MNQEANEQTGVGGIRISDFAYPLPDERIARHPLSQRDRCRLLVCDTLRGLADRHFDELDSLLPERTLMVCNNTRVINARLRFRKSTGATVEVFLLEPLDPSDYASMFQCCGRAVWRCMIGNLKRWKEGELTLEVPLSDGTRTTLTARRLESMPGNSHAVELSWDTARSVTLSQIVEGAGRIPIPPYLNRDTEDTDEEDYQTVYSKILGSVAAPTAGLHFTDEILQRLEAKAIKRAEVTLHVGAGTFQPVKTDLIGGHDMHTETYEISRGELVRIIDQVERGWPITAVGTTSVRTLESLPYAGAHLLEGTPHHVSQWEAYSPGASAIDTLQSLRALLAHMDASGTDTFIGTTAIMIAPGFHWRLTDSMITNFHQPRSTLLLLVSSFLGHGADGTPCWRRVYDHALRHEYRFLSYGDACLFYRTKP